MIDEIHVMMDLETWGTAAGSAIRSVGAVVFCPETGRLGDEFYSNVSDESCEALGLVKDANTVAFWAQPKNAKANEQLAIDPLPIEEVVRRFTSYWNNAKGEFVWSQGSNFDEPLLGHVYRRLGLPAPWKFYASRDTRTAYHYGKRTGRFNEFAIKRAGTYHNALDDAKHQAMCVHRATAAILRR